MSGPELIWLALACWLNQRSTEVHAGIRASIMTLSWGSTRIEQVTTGLGRDDLIRDRRCRAQAGQEPISSVVRRRCRHLFQWKTTPDCGRAWACVVLGARALRDRRGFKPVPGTALRPRFCFKTGQDFGRGFDGAICFHKTWSDKKKQLKNNQFDTTSWYTHIQIYQNKQCFDMWEVPCGSSNPNCYSFRIDTSIHTHTTKT
jgi:hypothetical protein